MAFGCQRVDPDPVWLVLDFPENSYQRCDAAGCDTYLMAVTEKGLFTYIQLQDHPDVFWKIGLANMFVEVAAQGVTAMNAFGFCRPVP